MPTADPIDTALDRLHTGTTSIELVHKPYHGWPYPRCPNSAVGSPTATGLTPLRIAVLDSSFNPPTLAHRALALLPAAAGPTEARLLLLSVRNADKAPRPGDATPAQRVAMMVRLARNIDAGVALVDAPAFVHKAERLRGMLPCGAQLAFVQGIDTLERFLAPRYYGDGSPEAMRTALDRFFAHDGDDARIVCVRRAMKLADPHGEAAIIGRAQERVQDGRIIIVDINEELQGFSSSEVRAQVRARDGSWRKMVPDDIADYIEEQHLYLDLE
ncbi:hypothetical protein BC834DRAFT_882710 [Gloeopeniophorella convolvens]|nr:hypothetical protein BC834DRAFT_882710 [Gloeopeniophorella convolvens]